MTADKPKSFRRQIVGENMLYFVSDVHGEYDLFQALLRKINFCASDQMVIVGDIVDKGPESIRLAQFVFSQPNISCLMGNHEYAFLRYYWAMMEKVSTNFDGALKKLQEYFQGDGHLLDWDTVDAFERLPWYIEGSDYICVHAGIPLDEEGRLMPFGEVERERLVYDRDFKEPNVLPSGSKCVLFGHTPACYVSGENRILRYPKTERPSKISDYYKIHLDMGTMSSGVLGCICKETLEEFYVTK